MKAVVHKVAKFLGFRTSYHISWEHTDHAFGAKRVGSMTVSVSPWISSDNYAQVANVVRDDNFLPARPVILSITKLGW